MLHELVDVALEIIEKLSGHVSVMVVPKLRVGGDSGFSLPALGVWTCLIGIMALHCLVFFEVCQLELGTTLFPKTLQYFNCFYEVIAKLLVAAIGP